MLAESSLSFLGIGIQPPDVSWGLMVSQGRQYLQTAWWLSIFPGVAIVVTTIAANVLAAWLRIATDPGPALAPGTSPQAADRPHPSQGGKAVKTATDQAPANARRGTTAPAERQGHDVVLQVRDLAVDIRTPAAPCAPSTAWASTPAPGRHWRCSANRAAESP